MYQNRFPFYDSSGNSASTDQSCYIVVHKMQDDRDPDVVCFHISKSKEYAQCNTGDKLCGNTLKPCIRCIVKQVQREDTIENKMYQNRFPFYDSSGNSASTDQSCNIVVHKMQDDRDPEVVCFHVSKSKEYAQCTTGDKLCGNTLKPCIRCIVKQVQREMPQSPEYTKDENLSKSKEYAQCTTGDKLCGNTLKPCIRCIVKQVQREMPQSPEYTKDENSFSHSKMLLQDRLQTVPPSILFSEESGEDKEKADKQRKQ